MPEVVYAVLGYRSVYKEKPYIEIKLRTKHKRLTDGEHRLLKQRQPIELIIGRLKVDPRIDHCHLKCTEGDALHALQCAAGYNIRWLLRIIIKKSLGNLFRLMQVSGLT